MSIFYLIKAKKGLIVLVTLAFIVAGLGLTLSQSLKYTSSLRLLVVQTAGVSTDAYALSKANEYLGQVLAKVSYSNIFFAKVLTSDNTINSNYFGVSAKERIKKWNKSIEAKGVKETGIISIKAYHTDRDQAERLAKAVALTIMTQHGNYHGQGDRVAIRLLDEPITSTYPDQPNVLVNFLISLVAGLIFAVAYVYLKFYDLANQTQQAEYHEETPSQEYQEPTYQTEELIPEPDPIMPGQLSRFPWQDH